MYIYFKQKVIFLNKVYFFKYDILETFVVFNVLQIRLMVFNEDLDPNPSK